MVRAGDCGRRGKQQLANRGSGSDTRPAIAAAVCCRGNGRHYNCIIYTLCRERTVQSSWRRSRGVLFFSLPSRLPTWLLLFYVLSVILAPRFHRIDSSPWPPVFRSNELPIAPCRRTCTTEVNNNDRRG